MFLIRIISQEKSQKCQNMLAIAFAHFLPMFSNHYSAYHSNFFIAYSYQFECADNENNGQSFITKSISTKESFCVAIIESRKTTRQLLQNRLFQNVSSKERARHAVYTNGSTFARCVLTDWVRWDFGSRCSIVRDMSVLFLQLLPSNRPAQKKFLPLSLLAYGPQTNLMPPKIRKFIPISSNKLIWSDLKKQIAPRTIQITFLCTVSGFRNKQLRLLSLYPLLLHKSWKVVFRF